MQGIVNTYYVEQGWHPETGIQFAGTLPALGIADYAAYAGSVAPPGGSPAELPPIVKGTPAAIPASQHQE